MLLHEEPQVAADPLFCSAAAFYGRRVIGVVLTGGGSDGTEGLRKVKAAGGIGVVQDPEEAAAPEMPRSALIGGNPDFVVPLDEMADLLARLVKGVAA